MREGRQTKGLHLHLFMQGTYQLDKETYEAQIFFNDTCQDVMSVIGTPNNVYHKSEELEKLIGQMNENGNGVNGGNGTSGAQLPANPAQYNDYFYNYITLGLDVLFGANTGRAVKFILHSNFPCHYNFNSYFMCNFEIPITLHETNQIFVVTPATTVT